MDSIKKMMGRRNMSSTIYKMDTSAPDYARMKRAVDADYEGTILALNRGGEYRGYDDVPLEYPEGFDGDLDEESYNEYMSLMRPKFDWARNEMKARKKHRDELNAAVLSKYRNTENGVNAKQNHTDENTLMTVENKSQETPVNNKPQKAGIGKRIKGTIKDLKGSSRGAKMKRDYDVAANMNDEQKQKVQEKQDNINRAAHSTWNKIHKSEGDVIDRSGFEKSASETFIPMAEMMRQKDIFCPFYKATLPKKEEEEDDEKEDKTPAEDKVSEKDNSDFEEESTPEEEIEDIPESEEENPATAEPAPEMVPPDAMGAPEEAPVPPTPEEPMPSAPGEGPVPGMMDPAEDEWSAGDEDDVAESGMDAPAEGPVPDMPADPALAEAPAPGDVPLDPAGTAEGMEDLPPDVPMDGRVDVPEVPPEGLPEEDPRLARAPGMAKSVREQRLEKRFAKLGTPISEMMESFQKKEAGAYAKYMTLPKANSSEGEKHAMPKSKYKAANLYKEHESSSSRKLTKVPDDEEGK